MQEAMGQIAAKALWTTGNRPEKAGRQAKQERQALRAGQMSVLKNVVSTGMDKLFMR